MVEWNENKGGEVERKTKRKFEGNSCWLGVTEPAEENIFHNKFLTAQALPDRCEIQIILRFTRFALVLRSVCVYISNLFNKQSQRKKKKENRQCELEFCVRKRIHSFHSEII